MESKNIDKFGEGEFPGVHLLRMEKKYDTYEFDVY